MIVNNVFNDIKELIINSRDKVYQTVNTEILNLYWNIGKIIMEIQRGDEMASYGEAIREKLSEKLTIELCKFSNCDDIVVAIELVSLFRTHKNRRRA